MKKLIFLLALLFATTFINDGRDDPRDIFFFMDDTTGTSWEGVLKGDLYYTALNGTTQYWSKTTPELQLMGTYSLSETFSDGDYTTGNAWTVKSGSYAVVDSVGYSGLAKSLRCATAGIISIPMNMAYGSWEFDIRKANTTNAENIYFMDNVASGTSVNGYNFQIWTTETFNLIRLTNGSEATQFTTATSYMTWLVPYRIKIMRNTAGLFSVYVKGGSFGDTYTLVSTTGGGGTNPVTDNTYTQSNYFVLDLDAGDMIANIVCEYGMGSMDLNGHELTKYPYQNSTFEGADTTYFGNNGTHSIDTSGTYKYAGSYAGKVISTGVGDTTTNFISLAYTQFGQIEAGKKYTVELWLNADSTGTSSTTKPLVYGKLGSKTMWGTATDSISIYAGLFRKFAFTFLATSAEVNTPLKLYFSAARTYYIDNFSITQAYDALFSYWYKGTDNVGGVMSKGLAAGVANGWEIIHNTDYSAHLSDGTITKATTKATGIFDNVWHSVSVKIDRTDDIKKYTDGVLTDSSAVITGIGEISNTTDFLLGKRGTAFLTGLVGETQITTFDDISTLDKTPAQIYARGKNKVHYYDSYVGGSIVGWWFNTATANDASGNGNNLTGTGSPSVSTLTTSY